MPLLDTTVLKDLLGTFISDFVLQLLSFVSENERQHMQQCQAEGIAAAKLRGVCFGRPPLPLPENFDELVKHWRIGEITMTQLKILCGMPETTIYRKIKEF